jgi:hypothetical protein
MEKLNFQLGVQEEKPVRTRQGHDSCEVYGCPRAGHIHSGVWNCRYHHGKGGSSLAQITLTLKNHAREFDWYEHMLNATQVDFLVGDIARKAPTELRVLPNENFKNYCERVKRHIDILLIPKSRLQEVTG